MSNVLTAGLSDFRKNDGHYEAILVIPAINKKHLLLIDGNTTSLDLPEKLNQTITNLLDEWQKGTGKKLNEAYDEGAEHYKTLPEYKNHFSWFTFAESSNDQDSEKKGQASVIRRSDYYTTALNDPFRPQAPLVWTSLDSPPPEAFDDKGHYIGGTFEQQQHAHELITQMKEFQEIVQNDPTSDLVFAYEDLAKEYYAHETEYNNYNMMYEYNHPSKSTLQTLNDMYTQFFQSGF